MFNLILRCIVKYRRFKRRNQTETLVTYAAALARAGVFTTTIYRITMESPYKGKTGLKRVWSALFYSLAGLRAAIRHEDAFRQEVLLACILVPAALFLPVGGVGKAMMIASVLLVLIVELLNSAVEAAVDHTSLDQHKLAKRAKDIGSAAVLLSLLNVVLVWLLILLN
jgi:diacylglycerol kinase (ATP)